MLRVQVIAIIAGLVLFLWVLELVRRGNLKEKYSILWLALTLLLLIFSFWKDLLAILSGWIGIFYPPSLIFLLAFVFLLLIVLHFSVVISRLTEKNRRLAQELGLLRLRVESMDSGKGQDRCGGIEKKGDEI